VGAAVGVDVPVSAGVVGAVADGVVIDERSEAGVATGVSAGL